MNKKILRSTLVGFFFSFAPIYSISIVYNLRVAQTTRRQHYDSPSQKNSIAILTPFGQWRKLYNETDQSAGGALATYMYNTKSFHAKVDFAAAHVKEDTSITTTLHTSRTQTDDILFTAGYTHIFNNRKRCSISALVGLPTHADTNLESFSFGTGHYGLGAQLDGAFNYSPNRHHTVFAAARYIYFFPRHAQVCINDTSETFNFALGNLVDLYVAHHSNWWNHNLEIGYNPTFAFGAHIDPPLDDIAKKTNFIRSSFYASYLYQFKIRTHPTGIAFAISYGFDQINKQFGNKSIVTFWALFGVNF